MTPTSGVRAMARMAEVGMAAQGRDLGSPDVKDADGEAGGPQE